MRAGVRWQPTVALFSITLILTSAFTVLSSHSVSIYHPNCTLLPLSGSALNSYHQLLSYYYFVLQLILWMAQNIGFCHCHYCIDFLSKYSNQPKGNSNKNILWILLVSGWKRRRRLSDLRIKIVTPHCRNALIPVKTTFWCMLTVLVI